jgi:hypothetical protein
MLLKGKKHRTGQKRFPPLAHEDFKRESLPHTTQ